MNTVVLGVVDFSSVGGGALSFTGGVFFSTVFCVGVGLSSPVLLFFEPPFVLSLSLVDVCGVCGVEPTLLLGGPEPF